MAARSIQGLKRVKPIFSVTKNDARLRVLNLYRAWYRTVPFISILKKKKIQTTLDAFVEDIEWIKTAGQNFDLTVNEAEIHAKIRELFEKNKHEKDVRVIDMLCVKGMQELDEVKHVWKQNCHVMDYFRETVNKKPDSFIGRFIDGHQPEPPK